MNHHLWRRDGTYYYRLRVPTHLVAALGKDVIQYSLKTPGAKLARKLRAEADAEWAKRFSQLEPGETVAAAAPSNPDVAQLVGD